MGGVYHRILPLASVAVLACSSPPPKPPPAARAAALERALAEGSVQPAPLERVPLDPDWDRCALAEWPDRLAQAVPLERACTLHPEDLRTLAAALPAQDERSLRALMLLARLSDPLATEICVAHLERSSAADASAPLARSVDRVAARALHSMVDFPGLGPRLEQLASGSQPHPDVEVRVECAVRALQLEKRRALEFLLAFSKLGTRLSARGANVAPGTEVSTAQMRALGALAQLAGIPSTLSPLDPIAEREQLVRAIESALAPRLNSGP